MTLRKKIIRTVQAGLLLGMLIFGFYPKVSDAWNRYVADQQISHYTDAVRQKADTDELDQAIQAAQEYNAALYAAGPNHIAEYTERIQEHNAETAGRSTGTDDGQNTGEDAGANSSAGAGGNSTNASAAGSSSDGLSLGRADDPEYESLLDVSSDGMMGTIDIDKIDVHLPIYHYTTDDVLSKGIGHLYGSSLPVGGTNSHAVLTGHRGLPSMMLFTDLDQLESGDTFVINILGQKLTYQVFRIDVVLPEEINDLAIQEGQDLVSLVTCTPYGVNTHRLIVTGERIETPPDENSVRTISLTVQQTVEAPVFIMGCAVLVLVAAAVFLVWVWSRRTIPEEEAGAGRNARDRRADRNGRNRQKSRGRRADRNGRNRQKSRGRRNGRTGKNRESRPASSGRSERIRRQNHPENVREDEEPLRFADPLEIIDLDDEDSADYFYDEDDPE